MPKIIVDERERSSKIPHILSRLGDYIVYKMLDVGDYIVANTIAVERKTIPDLVKKHIRRSPIRSGKKALGSI
jgi:ERCC4-type nuclease